jgi:hypothetical protein
MTSRSRVPVQAVVILGFVIGALASVISYINTVSPHQFNGFKVDVLPPLHPLLVISVLMAWWWLTRIEASDEKWSRDPSTRVSRLCGAVPLHNNPVVDPHFPATDVGWPLDYGGDVVPIDWRLHHDDWTRAAGGCVRLTSACYRAGRGVTRASLITIGRTSEREDVVGNLPGTPDEFFALGLAQ